MDVVSLFLGFSLKSRYSTLSEAVKTYPSAWLDFLLLLSIPIPSPTSKISSPPSLCSLMRLISQPVRSRRFLLTAIYETVEEPPSGMTTDVYLSVLYSVVDFVENSSKPLDEWCGRLCFMTAAVISKIPQGEGRRMETRPAQRLTHTFLPTPPSPP